MKRVNKTRIIAMLMAVVLVSSLLTTVASAASSVTTSSACAVETDARRPWWDIFGITKPQIKVTNKDDCNVFVYIQDENGVLQVKGTRIKKGKSHTFTLKKFNHVYSVYASGGIWKSGTKEIQVKEVSCIDYIW